MKIRVDQAKCTGHAMCNFHAPEVYLLDDLGYTALDGEVKVAAEHEAAARRGAVSCPERVITIIEE